MDRPRLHYFDTPASRGEECRIALHVAGVAFDDVRIKREDWPALKPTSPLGGLPWIEMPGRPPLAQSNAILALIGRLHGLHPADPFEAARHEAMMCHVEDLRAALGFTLRITDEAEKKAARERLVATMLPLWGQKADAQIGDGPLFAGSKMHVVDIKLYMVVRWVSSGKIDHVPASVFAPYVKLVRLHDTVRGDPRVKAWNARWT